METTKYIGKYLKITEENIKGKVYERVYIKPAIAIIPITSDNKILFVKELRRHENPRLRIKLVSGWIEEGEKIEETANRELQEEIGKKAKKIISYFTIKTTGTKVEEKYYLLALGLTDKKLNNPDGEETIKDVIPMTIEEMHDFVIKGNCAGSAGYVLLRLYDDIKNKRIILM